MLYSRNGLLEMAGGIALSEDGGETCRKLHGDIFGGCCVI